MSRLIIPVLLAGLASAYDGKGEEAVVGAGAPWGIPTDVFQQAVSQPNATGLFTIPGYNLSSPADEDMEKTRDWTVHVSVRGDVPLDQANIDSDDLPDGEGDKNNDDTGNRQNMVTAVTSFRIDAPEPAVITGKNDVNTFCAAIAFGFNSPTTKDGQDDAENDGECGFLKAECRDALVKGAGDAGSSCEEIDIPDACQEYFNDNVGMESFEMTVDLLGANRFFSFGSQPAMEQNETEYDIAVTNIWPVLFSWHHEAGDNTTSSASLRCLRSSMVAFDSRKPDEVPDRGDEGEEVVKDEPEVPEKPPTDEGDEGAASSLSVGAGMVVVGLISLFVMF